MRAGRLRVSIPREQFGKIIAPAILLMLFAQSGPAQDKPSYAELPNFHKVSERLYRGGQPRSGGIKRLAELGIKTIINLRGVDGQTRAEEAEAKAAGLA